MLSWRKLKVQVGKEGMVDPETSTWLRVALTVAGSTLLAELGEAIPFRGCVCLCTTINKGKAT